VKKTKVIIALDFPNSEQALSLVDKIGERGDFYKVGLELFSHEGPAIVEALKQRGKSIFLDLKLYDIPNTVAGAVRSAVDLGVDLMTLHTVGGEKMMRAAVEASDGLVSLLGVTVLTSMTASEVENVWGRPVGALPEEILRLGNQAKEAGLTGVVASPKEAKMLKNSLGMDFIVVTPGIRLAGEDAHDQARVSTPRGAVEAGADFLVVGRSITQSDDPYDTLQRLNEEIS
jgi:orotidine-5'-phosphate decarboxylase|tara:strand:+ start:7074 stop:7763 length:690 start_codon:yes stop_codon:yes gene_type:complete